MCEDRLKASGRNADLSKLVLLDQKINKYGCAGPKFDCFRFCGFARKRNITSLTSVSLSAFMLRRASGRARLGHVRTSILISVFPRSAPVLSR